MRKHHEMSMLPHGMDGRAYNGKGEALQNSYTVQRFAPGSQRSVRAVTPEDDLDVARMHSVQSSPRSIPGGEKPRDRRQGNIFKRTSDPVENATRSGPPVSFQGYARPRTRSTASTASKSQQRSLHDVGPTQSFPDPSISLGFPSIASKSPPLQKSTSIKGRRLVKRTSRPTSSLQTMDDVPSLNVLPYPVATESATKILTLMKTLCGRMKGEVEYQAVDDGPWYSGICYIDDIKGSLMYEGDDNGPFHLTVIPDLRGCRVRPVNSTERSVKCLELSHLAQGIHVRLLPMAAAQFDLWLAALLCWQQLRAGTVTTSPPRSATERRPGGRRRDSGFNLLKEPGNAKDANIIKVAKLLLWDKGAPLSPSAIVRRPSTRDLQSSSGRSWRRVSCILQDNGEFKLFTENDVTLLSIIQLSQLSRYAIQRLDKSVLDEEYSIAIFPQYTSTSTQLSIFRPMYIALESRIAYEVWFCLLRAFSIPEMYGPPDPEDSDEYDGAGVLLENTPPTTNDMFRMEKSLNVRVVEAKIRRPAAAPKPDILQAGKDTVKTDQRDPSIGDYLVEVILDGEVRARTITKTDTRNPFWREDCEFLDLPAYLPKLSIVLKRFEHPEVSNHGFLSSSSIHVSDHPLTEVVCGTVNVPVEKLRRSKDSETWWPILDENQEPIGEIFLKVRHEELVVLLAKEYQPISEMLHHFTAGLTVQIAQTIPTSLRHLSEILVNIFQVSGHAGEWLKTLVEDEIDGIGKELPVRQLPRWSRRVGSNESLASIDREVSVRDMGKSLQGEANLLFRGNSLLTQTFDFHMRRLGKEFLEDVLSEKILEINALNPDCEVDPSRLTHAEDVNKNWTSLIKLTASIWECIAESANRCPPELRQVLKYIRAVAEDRYGDFLRTVSYTSVSGFLFLRFFCPALLNPKLFGLLRDHPQPKAQRTLTLIAKSLQALANLSTFGQKEEWMEPMNRFLGSHRQAVKDYIDAICSIPSERTTFSLPASYSTPITILGRLPPTSREGFPSLPYLIDHARNFAALVKLWLEATSKVSPDIFEGDLATFNQLCIDLQRRTDECLSKAAGDRNADQLSLQWEDIVEGLDSSIIHEAANPEPESHSPSWTEYSASITSGQRLPPGSAGSEAGSKERKDRQSFWEATFGKDSRYQRPYQYEEADSSPPSRGQSRNGKSSRSFLSGLRRKGKGETPGGALEKDTSITPSPGASWNGNTI